MADSPILEVADRAGRCLRATFVWQRDRYTHRIEVLEQGQATICLATDEGDTDDQWPASPPLQQYSMETRTAGRRVALLVGMAGKSHWSASVEGDETTTSLVFDVACRVGRRPQWLGSTYRTDLPITREDTGAPIVVVGNRAVRLAVDPVDAPCNAGVTQKDGRVSVVAPLSDDRTPPFTVRWKYRIKLCG